MMRNWIKKTLINTPFEKIARRIYIRLNSDDRETIRLMGSFLTRQSNCIDIGAHRGSILSEIIAIAPEGNHYAFEPVPVHYQYLVQSFLNVTVLPFALSNKKGQEQFFHNVRQPTRSSFSNLSEPSAFVETIFVETDTLDQVIPNSLPIRLIKIDVEGAELVVLQGGIRTIKSNQPVLIFEHSRDSANGDEKSKQLFHLLVTECGYKILPLKNWRSPGNGLSIDQFITDTETNCYFCAFPKMA